MNEELTINERVRKLRKELGLTLDKFGENIGLKKAALSLIENGKSSVTDQTVKSICREFNVDYIWLTTGEGEMFRQIDPDDEVAMYVSEVIDEKDNPFFSIILETMRTYKQLNPENQKIISAYCKELLHNLQSKKES